MRILAIHAGMHDSSAAAFDDYQIVAAVSEERLTRVKGAGESVPWLAIDEVLRIAGWSRRDVDAIATTRAGSRRTLQIPLWRDFTTRSTAGAAVSATSRAAVLKPSLGVTTLQAFRADRFLKDNLPSGHANLFRNNPRGACACRVSTPTVRRADLYVAGSATMSAIDAWPKDGKLDCTTATTEVTIR